MKRALLAACLVIIVVAGAYLLVTVTPLGMWSTRNAGPFDRERLAAVVAQVRLMGIAPNEEKELRLADLSRPGSLRAVQPNETFARGQGAGCVWAKVSADGKLTVVIETRDLGHAGEYGFAYSDAPLLPKPFGKDWFTIDVPGHLNIVLPEMRIDEHWWRVLYNLG
ncbi:MAG: hypothetical protein NTW87_23540 [Planctomycetota bacterium]|nr:hypothetical protein [Planctomycetota bacterium]